MMDSSERCKCCLEGIGLRNLWDEYYSDGEKEVYGEMITDCFALPWSAPLSSDSEHICLNCVSRLRDAVTFKKEILHSDQLLKVQIKKEKGLKEEDESETEIETEYLSIEYLDDDEYNNQSEERENKKKNTSTDSNREPVKEEPPFIPTRKYTPEDLNKCIELVQREQMTLNQAATLYNIPRTTIRSTLLRRKKNISKKKQKSYTEDNLQKCLDAVISNKMTQTKASVLYNVPRRTISTALARMRDMGCLRPEKQHRNKEHHKRQQNLDILLNYTTATPFKGFRAGYVCFFCNEEYMVAAHLKQHTAENHATDPECKVFVNECAIKLDVTDLTCKICNGNVDSLDDAMEHLRLDHDLEIETDVTNHLVPFAFDNDSFTCVVCRETFTAFKLLNDHIHSTHYKNYECDVCGRGFISKKSIVYHMRRHETGSFVCEYCNKEYLTHERRVEHTRAVHLGFKRKPNKCGYCGEGFANIIQKKRHEVKVHNAARQMYKCQACPKQFDNQRSLRIHTNTVHLQMRPHRCNECGLTYGTKNKLRAHMSKHFDSDMAQCPICLRFYKTGEMLREHLATHADGKRHSCEYCGRSYLQKGTLRMHVLAKHPDKYEIWTD